MPCPQFPIPARWKPNIAILANHYASPHILRNLGWNNFPSLVTKGASTSATGVSPLLSMPSYCRTNLSDKASHLDPPSSTKAYVFKQAPDEFYVVRHRADGEIEQFKIAFGYVNTEDTSNEFNKAFKNAEEESGRQAEPFLPISL